MDTSAHGSCCLGGREAGTHLSQADTHTHESEPPLGGNWFSSAAMTTQAAQQPRTPGAAQSPDSAQAVPYENHHLQDAPEALTTESVEPCTRRGCTHFSW